MAGWSPNMARLAKTTKPPLRFFFPIRTHDDGLLKEWRGEMKEKERKSSCVCNDSVVLSADVYVVQRE